MTFPMHMVGLLKPKGLAFGTDYQDVYDAYITKPDLADAEVDNIMINGWVSDGVWEKIDGIWIFANHVTGADSLRNWRIPANTATAYNAPAWDQWQGSTGNALNAYIDLNWNPSVDGVNFVQDSASAGCYIRNNTIVAGDDFGIDDHADPLLDNLVYLASRWGGTLYDALNSSLGDSVANADSRGMYIINRTASNIVKTYKNKGAIINGTVISSAIPSLNMYVLCLNNVGSAAYFVDHQHSLFFAGSGLTQTDVDNITDRFETRMDYHETGVIAA